MCNITFTEDYFNHCGTAACSESPDFFLPPLPFRPTSQEGSGPRETTIQSGYSTDKQVLGGCAESNDHSSQQSLFCNPGSNYIENCSVRH